uniref:Subtilisin n=1 Tax=Calcidiscus leptoporus TaxID=127549 RepID=A0A7S0NZ73_9EUKA|mmetsp:Transcript_41855/g.98052  ORF Transcript_41855/g.98052 Transcript_41855/m.98052 type:complete len:726 (+) Transcript_41855:789-2966(+)
MNPADMPSTLAVGALHGDDVAPFSSRGMTTWELPEGYGRIKPDLLAPGTRLLGAKRGGGCTSMSGTSVASPVASAAAALLAGALLASPGADGLLGAPILKQALIDGATRLERRSAFEQGGGALSVSKSLRALLTSLSPKLSSLPAEIDLRGCTADGAPLDGSAFLWPLCAQPLFYSSAPLLLNLTLLYSGLAPPSNLTRPPMWVGASEEDAQMLEVRFETHDATLGVGIVATPASVRLEEAVVRGEIIIEAASTRSDGSAALLSLSVPTAVRVVRPPPRHRRLLWDMRHSISYPPAYVPRDWLEGANEASADDMLDREGDHPHTNFRGAFAHLRSRGYVVEVLGCALTAINASEYGALLLVDPEDAFSAAEVAKLSRDVREAGLSLVVLAEWYSEAVARKLAFYDDEARGWRTPITGGANVPALNLALAPFGIAFSEHLVLSGELRVGERTVAVRSATAIDGFPAGGYIVRAPMLIDEAPRSTGVGASTARDVPMLGLLQLGGGGGAPRGRLAVFGDSSFADEHKPHASAEASAVKPVHHMMWLLDSMVDFAASGVRDERLFAAATRLDSSLLRASNGSTDADALGLLAPYSRAARADECLPLRLCCGTMNEAARCGPFLRAGREGAERADGSLAAARRGRAAPSIAAPRRRAPSADVPVEACVVGPVCVVLAASLLARFCARRPTRQARWCSRQLQGCSCCRTWLLCRRLWLRCWPSARWRLPL